MAVNSWVVLCLRKGIRFQRYVKYKAKCEANFSGGEKRIRFGGKVEDGKAVVLAANETHHVDTVGTVGRFFASTWGKGIGRRGVWEGGDVRVLPQLVRSGEGLGILRRCAPQNDTTPPPDCHATLAMTDGDVGSRLHGSDPSARLRANSPRRRLDARLRGQDEWEYLE